MSGLLDYAIVQKEKECLDTMKRTKEEIRAFLVNSAERMRQSPTKAEEALRPWMTMAGFEFQYVFEDAQVILDFYHPVYKVCVEVDGGYHKKRKGPDDRRARLLKKLLGIETMRFKNSEALQDAELVMKAVREHAAQLMLERAGLEI